MICPDSKHDSQEEPGNEPDQFGIRPENWFWTHVSMFKTFDQHFRFGEQLEKLDRPLRSFELEYLKTHREVKDDMIEKMKEAILESSQEWLREKSQLPEDFGKTPTKENLCPDLKYGTIPDDFKVS